MMVIVASVLVNLMVIQLFDLDKYIQQIRHIDFAQMTAKIGLKKVEKVADGYNMFSIPAHRPLMCPSHKAI